MDLVEGKSLRAHLVDGPLELPAALDILEVIADALDAAHSKGVVHRDLKPDNIVLSKATPPKIFVLDFGIAKLVSKANEGAPAGAGTLTGQGTWLGTPQYMAPEQWSVDGAGPASDRYALGVIAFELLAGAPPFSATSVPGMMEQHFRAEVPALSSRGAVGMPTAVDAVLRRALAKDPDARHETARELVQALRNAAGTGLHRARGAIAPPTTPRKLWVPAAAGAGVLGVALVAAVATRDRGDKPMPARTEHAETPAGTVPIDITSMPPGADVKIGDKPAGTTPTKLHLPPGTEERITVSKPGYLAETRTVKAGPSGGVAGFTLGEVLRFQGVWRTKEGELRELRRQDDRVSVYKLTEVAGDRTFFKHYKFTAAERGIAFASDDEVVDPRAPQDPHCHVPVHVEYRYDPEHDVLELHRDTVKIDLQDGSCIVRSRKVEPTRLARVDDQGHDTVEIPAPAWATNGPKQEKVDDAVLDKKKPPTKVTPKQKAVVPLDPRSAEIERREEQKRAKNAKLQKKPDIAEEPTAPYTQPPNDVEKLGAQANEPPSQILPQPQAPPPTKSAEPVPQQQQVLPPKQKR
jgi:hypothetical protein